MSDSVLRLLDMAEALISGYDGQAAGKRNNMEGYDDDTVSHYSFGSGYEAYESENEVFAAAENEKALGGLTPKELSDVFERDARRY